MNFTRQTIPTVTAAQEEPKQNSTAKQATVNIRVDANCSLLCDGEYIETLFQANKITKMNFPIGQHLLDFFDMDYPDIIIEQEVDWPEEGKSYLVNIKGLQEKIEAAKAAEAEKKRLEAENKAKEEAERKAKEEAEKKAKKEEERKAKEEAERKAKEEVERKAKEEAEQKAKAEAEKKAKEDSKYRRIINGHECVDLGLSVCWATCNMGASSPEEVGDYFAWGETSPKESFSKENYTYYNGINNERIYFGSGKIVPGGDITGGKHDAAAVRWGGGWRMPTKEEWRELWEKKRNFNLINGAREIVARNKQTLIIPYCNNFYGHGTAMTDDRRSYYWTGNNDYKEKRYVADLFSGARGVVSGPFCDYNNSRWDVHGGCPIRPVLDKKYFK